MGQKLLIIIKEENNPIAIHEFLAGEYIPRIGEEIAFQFKNGQLASFKVKMLRWLTHYNQLVVIVKKLK
jgi:hypothetical protein